MIQQTKQLHQQNPEEEIKENKTQQNPEEEIRVPLQSDDSPRDQIELYKRLSISVRFLKRNYNRCLLSLLRCPKEKQKRKET